MFLDGSGEVLKVIDVNVKPGFKVTPVVSMGGDFYFSERFGMSVDVGATYVGENKDITLGKVCACATAAENAAALREAEKTKFARDHVVPYANLGLTVRF